MQFFGGISILLAICAPMLWTFAAFHARKTMELGNYATNDLAIDRSLIQSGFQTVVFLTYLTQFDFDLTTFIQG